MSPDPAPPSRSNPLSIRHSRRVVMRAASILGAWVAAGGPATLPMHAAAQSAPTTLSNDWDPAANVGPASVDGFTTIETEFPISAVSAHWNAGVGTWPVIEIQLSLDGALYTDSFFLTYDFDAGRPTTSDRLHSSLVQSGGARSIRFRTIDANGDPAAVAGLILTYISTLDGPTRTDLPTVASATTDPSTPPPIVSRSAWGADETLRFENGEEVWLQEYATVEHAVIHHTETQNLQDPVQAIRSIYYYHAVTRGWADIGYNYLVDRFGTIYQGRVGGQNVVAGHAIGHNVGSSGVALLGSFTFQEMTPAAQSGLVAIIAWLVRHLDPLGQADFWATLNLPTICGHRDVQSTNCPGDFAYDDIPEIRQLVAAALAELPAGPSGGLIVDDVVIVATDDGGPLNIRQDPGLDSTVKTQFSDRSVARVLAGPVPLGDGNWYQIRYAAEFGWATADFLELAPAAVANGGSFRVGDLLAVGEEPVDLFESPTLSVALVSTLDAATEVEVIDGPRFVDEIVWYRIRNGVTIAEPTAGWAGQTGFVLLSERGPEPSVPLFDVGDTIRVTASLNLRTAPSTTGSIIATMATDTIGTVLSGPTTASGYEWWEIRVPVGTGWAASINLVKTTAPPPPPPPPATFDIGDTVRVASSLRLRTTPSTSGSILTTMATGTTGTIIGGPVDANGYEWWQMSGSAGTGWAASIGLVETTAPPPPPPPPPSGGIFDIGDTVRVQSSLRLRSAPSTSGAIISTMATGTLGTVLAGPTNADGYAWWQIQVSAGNGWAAGAFLVEVTTPPPGGTIDTGDQVVTTSALRLRSSPSLTASVITTMPAGTIGVVLAGPQTANGYIWWQIVTPTNTGWAAGEFLALS